MSGSIGVHVFGIVLIASVIASLPIAADAGNFEKLSRRNQMIARALFEAQITDATSAGLTPLTLEEIGSLRLQGHGWGSIYRDMESRGLIRERSLGHLVVQFIHPRSTRLPSSAVSTSENSDPTRMVEGEGHQE